MNNRYEILEEYVELSKATQELEYLKEHYHLPDDDFDAYFEARKKQFDFLCEWGISRKELDEHQKSKSRTQVASSIDDAINTMENFLNG